MKTPLLLNILNNLNFKNTVKSIVCAYCVKISKSLFTMNSIRGIVIASLLLLLTACADRTDSVEETIVPIQQEDPYADIPLGTATVTTLIPAVTHTVLSQPLPTRTPSDTIEVLEVFWYGCPHCNALQPYLYEWNQRVPSDVTFIRVPAPFDDTWEVHARTFYTAEALDVIEQSHAAFFHAIHERRQALFSVSRIADFFTAFGIEKDQFIQVYESFGIEVQMDQARRLMIDYGLNAVPVLLVNGKYKIDGTLAGSEANMIRILELLIESERLLFAS